MRAGSAQAPKLVIYGIDAADFSVMGEWLQEGRLPHLQSLIGRGVAMPMRSLTPPLTPPAWTTIMTGANPGRHGIVDFVLPTAGSYGRKIASSRDRMSPPLWTLVNRAGMSCGVFNVPFTYPPDAVDGYVLAGNLGAPKFREDVVYPRSLYSELRDAVGELPLDPVVRTKGGYDVKALEHQINCTAAACNHLMEHHPTDVFIGVVSYVDHLQHFFYGRGTDGDNSGQVPDMLLYGYQAADRLLGDILARCDEQTHVLVVSDHGAGPLHGYLNINRLLNEVGLLRWRRTSPLLRHLQDQVKDMPGRLRRKLQEWFPALDPTQLDWKHTEVFPRRPSGGLYLNLKGREPEGTIAPEDYERRREEIIELLQAALARYPEIGNCRFYRREELYAGQAEHLAPDIAYSLDDFAFQPTNCEHAEAGTVITLEEARRLGVRDGHRSGWHSLNGVLIAAGPRITSASGLKAKLADIAPTALELLGVTAATEFDGQVLTEIIGMQAQSSAAAAVP